MLGHISERCLVELGMQSLLKGDKLGELDLLEEMNIGCEEVKGKDFTQVEGRE